MTDILKETPPPASEQRWFGRLKAKDPRDRRYAMQPIETERVTRFWTPPFVLDQGPTARCVAFSSCAWLMAGPVRNTDPLRDAPMVEKYADALYHDCQRIDEWPGEDYEGTSVRASFKILKERGFIAEYHWAFDAETVARHVLEVGPVVVGTDWTMGMNDPAREFISYSGSPIGGHAWLIYGFSRMKRTPGGGQEAFRLQNSWGKNWGWRGKAWVSKADLQRLIEADGEAAAATEVDIDMIAKSSRAQDIV